MDQVVYTLSFKLSPNMTSASTFPFCTTEHVIDGQYIREYPRATLSQDSPVKLVVKKYTPKNNSSPQPGDVTIVGAHGCGFPKVPTRDIHFQIEQDSEELLTFVLIVI